MFREAKKFIGIRSTEEMEETEVDDSEFAAFMLPGILGSFLVLGTIAGVNGFLEAADTVPASRIYCGTLTEEFQQAGVTAQTARTIKARLCPESGAAPDMVMITLKP